MYHSIVRRRCSNSASRADHTPTSGKQSVAKPPAVLRRFGAAGTHVAAKKGTFSITQLQRRPM